ncbi:MAG TPA: class I SAM-dependent methyltransferase [Saprospiraceae bacterium]|nr:class I SAM-dependent methyltransferase [Saprospiraceae bacterium]HMQ84247.1 class I SAM-dependent methyltransferase [Saprospiraceae bacterium]
MSAITKTTAEQNATMQRYYVLQSKIYDLTRWAFLFGRKSIIRQMPFQHDAPLKILEIGCGTGYNLRRMARRFAKAQLTGMDVSSHMIQKSQQSTARFGERVRLIQEPYQLGDPRFAGSMDLVLFSYSLTMINPQWSELIEQAKKDLKPGGIIAVTDFHDSRFGWFKRHMGSNHVRMDGHLVPFLDQHFQSLKKDVKPAYGGIWHYFVYLGKA